MDPEAYRIGNCFSVTIRTSFHRHIFDSSDAVNVALRSLHESVQNYRARVYAYCFMPDHLHLLAWTPPGVDFLQFVNSFKQRSGLGIRMELEDGRPVWQPRFYDHALRSSEGILTTMRYIFANPIRAGLVANVDEYPHSGSFEWPDILTSGLESPGLHSTVFAE
jgi:REP element-mobilizing transposase RayT